MVVCHVWDSEYPWDVRAEKVSLALTEAGHEVHIVARNRDARPTTEVLPEGTVHRMHPLPLVGRRANSTLGFPAFFNPRWLGLIRRVSREQMADLILCRDLPLAPACIRVGRQLGIPVVLDMAENYPAMIQAVWDHERHRKVDYLIRNPVAVRRVEEWVLRHIDHVVVVVEESGERLVSLGLPPDRVTVASNTPVDRRIPENLPVPASAPPLHLVYIGLLEAPRGLEVVLEALARLRDGGFPAHCSIVGNGRDEGLLHDQALRLGLTSAEVSFHGRLPYEEALEVVRSSHIGLVPHLANASWNSTIPNKLFDYMSFGIPVVTSDARPAARVVRETGCGEVYRSRDPDDLARAVRALADDDRRRALGQAGRNAVLSTFRWREDGARMVAVLEEVAAGR